MGVEEVLRNQLYSSEKSVEGEGQTDQKRTIRNSYTNRARVIAKERKTYRRQGYAGHVGGPKLTVYKLRITSLRKEER